MGRKSVVVGLFWHDSKDGPMAKGYTNVIKKYLSGIESMQGVEIKFVNPLFFVNDAKIKANVVKEDVDKYISDHKIDLTFIEANLGFGGGGSTFDDDFFLGLQKKGIFFTTFSQQVMKYDEKISNLENFGGWFSKPLNSEALAKLDARKLAAWCKKDH